MAAARPCEKRHPARVGENNGKRCRNDSLRFLRQAPHLSEIKCYRYPAAKISPSSGGNNSFLHMFPNLLFSTPFPPQEARGHLFHSYPLFRRPLRRFARRGAFRSAEAWGQRVHFVPSLGTAGSRMLLLVGC